MRASPTLRLVRPEISQFLYEELMRMLRVSDHAGFDRDSRIAPRAMLPSVSVTASAPRTNLTFAAQWLACAHPCQRFARTLAAAPA